MSESLPPEFATELAAATERVGCSASRIFYYSVVSSTNDVAARLAVSGAGDGTTVLVGAQTAGRGRRGHSWYSPPGAGLYFSTVLRGPPSPLVTLMAGVVVADAIRDTTGLGVELKWPNDIVVPPGVGCPSRRYHPRKVGGILAERVEDAVVLGIGINVCNAAYPVALQRYATSLEGELDHPVERPILLIECLAGLLRWRGSLAADGSTQLLDRWRELSPTSEGTPVSWSGPVGRHRGLTSGVDADGALIVNCGRRMERIVGGEVRWA